LLLLLPQWLFLREWLHKGLFYWLLLLGILLLSKLVDEWLLDRLRKYIWLWTLYFLLLHEGLLLFLEMVRLHWLVHKGLFLLRLHWLIHKGLMLLNRLLVTRLLSRLLVARLLSRLLVVWLLSRLLLLLLLELFVNMNVFGLLLWPILHLRVCDAEQVCELLRGCVLLLLLQVPLVTEHVQASLLVATRGCTGA